MLDVFETSVAAPPAGSTFSKEPEGLVLQAQDLTRRYRMRRGFFQGHDEVRALERVSLSLARGRTLAVVGESGCGKSTLARVLTLMESPNSGRLWIDGVPAEGAIGRARSALRLKTQMVFQNPYASLNPRQTIGATLEEPLLLNRPASKSQRREQAQAMMERVGLRPDHLDRYPHMFSGGQRQRIAIARALMLAPPVIVADEPTSALDVSVQAQILNLLMDLQASTKMAMVFISHNLAVVEHVADEVMVLFQGCVVEAGSKRQVLNQPLHPYTQALHAAVPKLHRVPSRHIPIDLVAHAASVAPSDASSVVPSIHASTRSGAVQGSVQGCAFWLRCPQRLDMCAQSRPQLHEVDGRRVACHRVNTP